jgi:hypothetical protein
MANGTSSQGQLLRKGIKSAPMQKKRNRRFRASRVRESFLETAFTEKGADEEQTAPPSGAKPGKGRVYLVTIIEEGLGNSKDRNYYSGEALRTGTELFNGTKAYCDHPDAISEKTLPERSMRDVVGWYSDCFTDKNPDTGKIRLRGKLHFFPDAKWLTDKIDIVLTDPTAKNLFGLSINAVGKTRQSDMNGQPVNYVEEFQRVDSTDVVTEPAARGKFDKMLESRRRRQVSSGSKVNKSMQRTREAAALGSEETKEIADSLVSAYNSDNPDELKQAAFEASKRLHAASSISGRGPGQVNEEQYSNITPSGGSEEMKTRVKASGSRRNLRKKKHLKAAAGTGPDNEQEEEPSPEDIEGELEESAEADVEDEENDGDLGEFDDFGDSSKKVKASGRPRRRTAHAAEAGEDEAFEDEDESLEDEDEMGGSPMAAPTGGGSPGSSRAIASHHEAGDDDDDDDQDDDDDDSELDEAMEDEGFEDEDEHDMGGMPPQGQQPPQKQPGAGAMPSPGMVAESGRRARHSRFSRRSQEADGNASLSGGLGRSGHKALPKGADPTRGYEDSDEDFGKRDDSTSGVGKSYKLKTSKFRKNRLARRVAHEANRRIELLERGLQRLRESNSGKDRKISIYRGKIRFRESVDNATRLLREAVRKDLLTVSVAKEIAPQLYSMPYQEQVRQIKVYARLLESAQEGSLVRMQESVEGIGVRGGAAFRESAASGNSDLADSLEQDGIPLKQQD